VKAVAEAEMGASVEATDVKVATQEAVEDFQRVVRTKMMGKEAAEIIRDRRSRKRVREA
jgi:hypothetical protein